MADYNFVGANYGTPPPNPAADLNGDGTVDYGDLLIVIPELGRWLLGRGQSLSLE